MRGATEYREAKLKSNPFQSNAPRAGCNATLRFLFLSLNNFNQRTPCGVRPQKMMLLPDPKTFQSTHPMRSATNASYYVKLLDQ